VEAQGGKGAPVSTKTFTVSPDDAGLFIAGDGSASDGAALEAVDGHVYGIPMAVFDRAAGDTNITTDDLQADTRVATTLGSAIPTRLEVVPFVIGGSDDANDITTGKKVRTVIPFSGTITKWTLLADAAASITIDINKSTYAGFPTTATITGGGGGRPALSSEQKATDSTLSGWTTSVTAGDILEIEVEEASGNIKNVTLALEIEVA
jgi:hypothetical protein